MTVRLDNKIALITGATAGIGKGIATVLAERGATVVGMARRPEAGELLMKEIESAGGACTFIAGDICRAEDCNAAVRTTVEQHGRLDILINNAAKVLPFDRTEDMSDETWRSVMNPTLDGVFYMSRAALPVMQAQHDGVILTIASVAGVQSFNRMGAYGASKAGVISLMRTIAVENVELGVRANAIILGSVFTGLAEEIMGEMGRYVRGEDWTPDLSAGLGRLGKVLIPAEQVGRAVAVLCSDDAREINGSAIAIDRAWTAGLLSSELLYMGAAQEVS